MENFNLFLLKSSLIAAVLEVIYSLLFKNMTFFRLNRWYLIVTILTVFSAPFLSFSTSEEIIGTVTLPLYHAGFGSNYISNSPNLIALTILETIYLIGVIVVLVRLGIGMIIMYRSYLKFPKIEMHGFKIVLVPNNSATFSFFNRLFISRNTLEEKFSEEILIHEKAHKVGLHSLDSLLSELFVALLWFNPFAWRIRKNLKMTHEFIADQEVLLGGYSVTAYTSLLFEKSTTIKFAQSMTNNFNYSLLKTRLIMITSKESNPIAKFFYIIFPVIVIATTFTLSSFKFEESFSITQEDKIYNNGDVDVMPKFQGGMTKLFEYLESEIVYPKEAKQVKKLNEQVYVGFVIEKNGKASNVKIVKSAAYGCDEAALNAVRNMPNWTPGQHQGKKIRFKFVIPIRFKNSK